MANDATNKTVPNSDPIETSTLASSGDQQKVPPLRIVLNSTSNQKTSSTTSNQQASTKKEKSQDGRAEGSVKGRVRIKLGTNKQQQTAKVNDPSETQNKRNSESSAPKGKDKGHLASNDKQEENINEESTSNFGHLRRITRRSQRTVQSISNEDEESISSMTSVDENLNTNTTQTNSDSAQDPEQSNPASSAASSASASNNATNGSVANTDTPRRYKRRKLESSESQSFECDSLLGSQNYKLPHQNSFELFKNIRKQVDKRLKNLNCVHPKTPLGLRDYMLARGAYLLDGNKLGNGTSLFMNEDGGLNTAPLGKYHVIRANRTHYSVPNKARVPAVIPPDSPLYDLFIEQEKERYRMRIQHIKEREKLTLAAEQEFVRAYGQAALAAANQDEPFSVCTLLKHQEIYNYLDSDGVTILSREDAQQDQINQSDGVRTRRRQHGQISPGPARRGSGPDESGSDSAKKDEKLINTTAGDEKKTESDATATSEATTVDPESIKTKLDDSKHSEDIKAKDKLNTTLEKSESAQSRTQERASSEIGTKIEKSENEDPPTAKADSDELPSSKDRIEGRKEPAAAEADGPSPKSALSDSQDATEATGSANKVEAAAMAVDEQIESTSQPMSVDSNPVISDKERRAANRDIFLAQLQEIDDKWDNIRREMLVRHRNEAESLHAIQKLEWEWKTKETEVCDVRTTLIIDHTFVPKLDVLSQDY